jgi:hypothetical protein
MGDGIGFSISVLGDSKGAGNGKGTHRFTTEMATERWMRLPRKRILRCAKDDNFLWMKDLG